MNYPGGKGADGVYQAIINLMPKHRVYIEPFLGGGAILRHKKPAAKNYGFEPDKEAFEAWSSFASADFEPARIAYGSGESEYHFRVPGLKIHPASSTGICLKITNCTFEEWRFRSGVHLDKFGTDALIYCDPPYLMETRSSKQPMYKHDFSTWFDHDELLRLLLTLKCNVMISGYDHPLYNEKLAGWRKTSFAGVSRGGPRVETVWMNFPEPGELHDYRYLGTNFREREQIKRQKQRWLAKLAGMPIQRRYALMAAIEEFADGESLPASIAGDGEARETSTIVRNDDAGPSKTGSAAASPEKARLAI